MLHRLRRRALLRLAHRRRQHVAVLGVLRQRHHPCRLTAPQRRVLRPLKVVQAVHLLHPLLRCQRQLHLLLLLQLQVAVAVAVAVAVGVGVDGS